MKTIIHVNRQNIAMNRKDGKNRPCVTVKQGRVNRYAKSVKIHGPSEIGELGEQLKCGATVWVETEAPVELIGEMTFRETRDM
jgi:hypothetical protein